MPIGTWMRNLLTAALTVGTGVALAPATTIYQPVQFQFGRHGEIFYGGANRATCATPPGPQMRAGVYTNSSYTPLYFHPLYLGAPQIAIYSDLRPGVDVSQYGFTIDDARNEAYANAPLYFAGNPAAQTAAQSAANAYPQANASAAAPSVPNYTPGARRPASTDRRADAIPLLDWAKAAHARGQTALVNALLIEAAKDDPQATAALRQKFSVAAHK